MFKTTESKAKGSLAFTGTLTTIAADYAAKVMTAIAADEDDKKELVNLVQMIINGEEGLDDLLDSTKVLDSFFDNKEYEQYNVDKEEANKILKSQQSKRSRLKSKDLEVFNNFKSYVTSYIAEKVIRAIAGLHGTGHIGARSTFSTEPFTTEELDTLKEDQLKVNSMIRNLQSRKSIAKKQEEPDEEFIAAVIVKEEQLKSIRDGSVKTSHNVAYRQIVETIGTIEDISKIKLADAKNVLQAITTIITAE